MTIQEIKVPDIGGSTDVEVIELSVSVGDSVDVDDALIVLESDKSTMEVPAPCKGSINEMRVAVGDKVSEGDLILLMDIDEEGKAEESTQSNTKPVEPPAEVAKPAISSQSGTSVYIEQIFVPDLGGAESVPIIEVSVKVGDKVEEDECILVLESDKATMEIPSPKSGKLVTLAVKEGDKLSQGDLIGELEVSIVKGAAESSKDETSIGVSSQASKTVKESVIPKKSVSTPDQGKDADIHADAVHAGPAVRKFARELGADLTRVIATGPRGRILKEDLEAYIKQQVKQAQTGASGTGSGVPTIKLPDFSQFGKVERRPLSRIHKLTAENMHASWLNVPHVTQFDESDITELEAFRKSQKAMAEQRGSRLTPLPFLLKACAYALEKYPQFNVALDLDSQEIIQKHYINIGVAVDTPVGLMVPVIKDVNKKGLWTLADETSALAEKAKNKKLMPADMQGGCFTISSLGSVGGTAFTPIVNSPEVAILGVSKASIKPVYINNKFEPRLMLPLSLSYDHRAVNGADAARFTTMLGVLLGDIRQLLL